MTTDLKALIEAELKNAINDSSELSEQREKALKYYLGQPYDNEIKDRSQVVTREVADTIEWMMPSMMRIFASGEHIAEFNPVGEGDEPIAKQATDYTNWIFSQDNPGFIILYNWIKDALLQKTGIVKFWWEEEVKTKTTTYGNLSEDELTVLLSKEGIEPVEHTVETDPTGQNVHSVKVKETRKIGRVRIDNVPNEEFFVSRKTKRLCDSPFIAHKTRRTRSSLIEEGYSKDQVSKIPQWTALKTGEEQARHEFDSTEPGDSSSLDWGMEEVEVSDCYLYADLDDKGISRLVRVLYAKEILLQEECDYIPFADLCPLPIPHRWGGLSVADMVMDLQLIRSTILRQLLDNIYLQNNASYEVVDSQVNLDDLLNKRPGRIVRTKAPGMISPLVTAALPPQTFELLSYIDDMREERTGVSRGTQGLDPDALHSTASGMGKLMTAAQSRVELIARIFSETGIPALFKGILKLVVKYQDKERIIRLSNKFVPMNPQNWDDEMDCTVRVGLGNSSREQQMALANNLINIQKQIVELQGGVQGPLVDVEKVYNALSKLVEASGIKTVDAFFIDPKNTEAQPQQPPPPDPKMIEVQQKMELERSKLESDIVLKREQMQIEAQLAQYKIDAEMQLKREQFGTEAALKGLGASVRFGGEIG